MKMPLSLSPLSIATLLVAVWLTGCMTAAQHQPPSCTNSGVKRREMASDRGF